MGVTVGGWVDGNVGGWVDGNVGGWVVIWEGSSGRYPNRLTQDYVRELIRWINGVSRDNDDCMKVHRRSLIPFIWPHGSLLAFSINCTN